MKRITINHYEGADMPEGMGWKLYSFGQRHVGYANPDRFFFDDSEHDEPSGYQKEIADKLKSGLAFVLSYFEHGNCVWSLEGTGPQCRWDNVNKDGILVFEGEEADMRELSYKQREQQAECFCEEYTAWCNGEVYEFSICELVKCNLGHMHEGEHAGWCCGFYGTDLEHMREEIRAELDGDTDVVVNGDASWIIDKDWIAHLK